MNYYDEIKQKLIDNEITKKVKDYSKNKSDLDTYYEVGKLLADAGKHYGEGIINEYSLKLSQELNKTYSSRSLRCMRQFYNLIQREKWQPLAAKITWSNWLELIKLKDINEMLYYINSCITYNLSKRQLREKIKSKEYERLPEETKNKLVTHEETVVSDFIKNPIIIKNTFNTGSSENWNPILNRYNNNIINYTTKNNDNSFNNYKKIRLNKN